MRGRRRPRAGLLRQGDLDTSDPIENCGGSGGTVQSAKAPFAVGLIFNSMFGPVWVGPVLASYHRQHLERGRRGGGAKSALLVRACMRSTTTRPAHRTNDRPKAVQREGCASGLIVVYMYRPILRLISHILCGE